jgi:hypothetical protein
MIGLNMPKSKRRRSPKSQVTSGSPLQGALQILRNESPGEYAFARAGATERRTLGLTELREAWQQFRMNRGSGK